LCPGAPAGMAKMAGHPVRGQHGSAGLPLSSAGTDRCGGGTRLSRPRRMRAGGEGIACIAAGPPVVQFPPLEGLAIRSAGRRVQQIQATRAQLMDELRAGGSTLRARARSWRGPRWARIGLHVAAPQPGKGQPPHPCPTRGGRRPPGRAQQPWRGTRGRTWGAAMRRRLGARGGRVPGSSPSYSSSSSPSSSGPFEGSKSGPSGHPLDGVGRRATASPAPPTSASWGPSLGGAPSHPGQRPVPGPPPTPLTALAPRPPPSLPHPLFPGVPRGPLLPRKSWGRRQMMKKKLGAVPRTGPSSPA